MTPLQSWATIALLIVLVCLLVRIIANVNGALDHRLAAKHASRSAPSGIAQQPGTSPGSSATPPIRGETSDGFPIPARDEVYDYAVHGL
ncbi:hypothetical protein [Arthrobacter bambusae]|uniref:Uncharacterized protein n=1 Tax=Arthrobacter bambusae TaxID=1338426 RepID=A0AAW8D6S4_9MICC|nr:hypothetical protein [Arthrobacter bambusae]MDP9904601.1 hypothetical protein [Arthrobacter bambusae]MDQ0129417.1 hypothetical protein [Arthrobacter bambusae]MDQ0180970.1 hypothetical protein [Arthrobacter bambusae]